MSEWDAIVFCTCFRDGLTTEPPVPRSQLTVNLFGVVTSVDSDDHAGDREDLWCWRTGMSDTDPSIERQPCGHDRMHAEDRTFHWPGSRSHVARYEVVERLVAGGDLPLLANLIHRPQRDDYLSGGRWVEAAETAPLLAELDRLDSLLPGDLPDGDRGFVDALRALLTASHMTGNPVILHYNGIADGAW